jgi:hypothetical protein
VNRELVVAWADGQVSQPLPDDDTEACRMVAALAGAMAPERYPGATWQVGPRRSRR